MFHNTEGHKPFHQRRLRLALFGYSGYQKVRRAGADDRPGPARPRLDELLVDSDVRGVAHAQGFFELVQGGAAPQEPYGEGVAEYHRGDVGESDLVAPLPEGVLEGLGGSHRTGGAACYQLGGFVLTQIQVAAQGFKRRFGEATSAGGEVGAWAAELHLGGVEV